MNPLHTLYWTTAMVIMFAMPVLIAMARATAILVIAAVAMLILALLLN